MQKSARAKKPMDGAREEVLEDIDQRDAGGGQPLCSLDLAEFSTLVRDLMKQQTSRDANLEHDRQVQEERWRRVQHQFAQLQQEVQADRLERQQLMEGAAADPGAVLEKYEISPETYQMRFRSASVRDNESPKELQTLLRDLYDKWIVPKEKTKEQIGDVIVM